MGFEWLVRPSFLRYTVQPRNIKQSLSHILLFYEMRSALSTRYFRVGTQDACPYVINYKKRH